MSEEYAHLQPSVRTLAEQSAEVRVRRIRADRWITYHQADAALAAMEDLLTFPKRTRMPNMLLCGPTNNGKTMIVERFRRCHTPIVASIAEQGNADVPVLKVQRHSLVVPPAPWLLARISEKTDVSVERLRQMTFEGFEPPYRDDEASARFAGRRYDGAVPDRRAYRFAVCGQCLEGDAHPYLRSSWLIGWMAVCPIHGSILIERCHSCGAGLRALPFSTAHSFSPTTCTRCSKSILSDSHRAAHPSVIHLQTALYGGKRDGVLEIEGLGRLTWKETIALADVLIGMVWTDLTFAEQDEIFRSYAADTRTQRRKEDRIYDCRHGSLHFLSWLSIGWPDSHGAAIGRHMLIRWLTAERNRVCRHLRPASADPWTAGPSNFDPSIRQRLQALASAR
jgi:hypothetical protein